MRVALKVEARDADPSSVPITSSAPDLVLDLPRSSSAAGIGRRALRRLLSETGAFELLHDAELATSELVTNAVMHTAGDIVMSAWFVQETGVLRVEVADDEPCHPAATTRSMSTGGGHGLSVIGAVTTSWGVEDVGAVGKVVWFEIQQYRSLGRRSA